MKLVCRSITIRTVSKPESPKLIDYVCNIHFGREVHVCSNG
jgi:hypothetical protein